MQHVSIPRFVLVHALISGMVSLGFPSLSGASPSPQPLDPPPPWINEQDDILGLEDVLVNPNVAETTAAELLASLGVDVTPTANAAITANGDLPSGGVFTVFVDGVPTEETVVLMARTKAFVTSVQREITNAEQEVVADSEMTVTMASATLVHDGAAKPVLCMLVKLVTQPREEEAVPITVTGVNLFGEAVNALTATAFVRQIADWIVPIALEQITPPQPPPPGMVVPCWAPCSDVGLLGAASCAGIYLSCVVAVLIAQFFSSTGLCMSGCVLLGPVLGALCVQGCLALCSGALAIGMAGCTTAFTLCMRAVAITILACVVYHC